MHRREGEITVSNQYGEWRLKRHERFGYYHVFPTPTDDYLLSFYESHYLNPTYSFHDALYVHLLETKCPELFRRRGGVLEIGCGRGDLLLEFKKRGFACFGFEPSPSDHEACLKLGLSVERTMFDFPQSLARAPFDFILMSNVLEHIPDPEAFLLQVVPLLGPDGVLLINVPSDFNPLQELYVEREKAPRWFLAPPTHLNYFSADSLERLCNAVGLAVEQRTTRFPMEIFLLAGLDYIAHPELGQECHRMRVAFEASFMHGHEQLLWGFYDGLASQGIGREAILICRQSRPRIDVRSLHLRSDGYSCVPLREQDAETIRQWRNAQVSVLRQTGTITLSEQMRWFDSVVRAAHAAENPPVLLFSILDSEARLIGYGGLTNIDWDHKRAELSFLVDPARARDEATYRRDFRSFLSLIKKWALGDLGLDRVFAETYAFRAAHIHILEEAGFRLEGRLRGHTIQQGKRVDSLVHAICRTDLEAPDAA
jgi:RimJ/RimL family protein N-acetyltransferase/2-polyprenyl-3-methyl-5-hydroxy-6-metoxy-1,4-benzoquinol methylase